MNIWLVEPYYTGSHAAWADGYEVHSEHDVRLVTLPGRFWKWRMQGGAVTLARRIEDLQGRPDLILASDMLNLPVFLALASQRLAEVPVALYFHENQLTYPLQPGEKRDLHYGFINFASALRADALFFNSTYHLDSFFSELPRLLKHFPDFNELWSVDVMRSKAQVLPVGLPLTQLHAHRPPSRLSEQPLILWNHRWEYDKDPETFFRAVDMLADAGLDFGLVLLGESLSLIIRDSLEARQRLSDRIVHFGYAEEGATYARLLWQSDIVVSTALHEFFGLAVVEACYCDCLPILPHRLSYPELIPAAHHGVCLYAGFEGLVERLREAIVNFDATQAFSLQSDMLCFDWRVVAPEYDRRLEDVASGARPGWLPPAARLRP